jgi:hypothetical protein
MLHVARYMRCVLCVMRVASRLFVAARLAMVSTRLDAGLSRLRLSVPIGATGVHHNYACHAAPCHAVLRR